MPETFYVELVTLPAGYVNRLAYQMRRELEQAVALIDGAISMTKAAWIDSAVKWERHGQLANRWLRLHSDDMDLGQRLEFSSLHLSGRVTGRRRNRPRTKLASPLRPVPVQRPRPTHLGCVLPDTKHHDR